MGGKVPILVALAERGTMKGRKGNAMRSSERTPSARKFRLKGRKGSLSCRTGKDRKKESRSRKRKKKPSPGKWTTGKEKSGPSGNGPRGKNENSKARVITYSLFEASDKKPHDSRGEHDA